MGLQLGEQVLARLDRERRLTSLETAHRPKQDVKRVRLVDQRLGACSDGLGEAQAVANPREHCDADAALPKGTDQLHAVEIPTDVEVDKGNRAACSDTLAVDGSEKALLAEPRGVDDDGMVPV
jgi:hypothetical protein